MSSEWECTGESRWLERACDSYSLDFIHYVVTERVLQQRWRREVGALGGSWDYEYRDVPTIKQES